MAVEEPHIIAALIDLMRDYNIMCLVQVGAEDGHEANEIRKAIDCRAICIEPDPKCGPCSPELEWHEAVIGEDNSVVDFYLHAVHGLSSKAARRDSMEILCQLPQYTLSKFCRKFNIRPDALIIDVEGCTMDVLRGINESLYPWIKVIYAEVNHDESRGPNGKAADVDEYLVARGYKRIMELPTYAAGAQSNWTFTR